MRLDWPALGCAAAIEAVLAGLATMGGPHGPLGAVPWALQLPGILLVFFVPGPTALQWRVTGMLLVQLALWYVLLAALRRLRRRRHPLNAASPEGRSSP